MPVIQFDCLVPDSLADQLASAFGAAMDRLAEAGKLESAAVDHTPDPHLEEGVEAQLRETFSQEHGLGADDMRVHRYAISLIRLHGSVNQLAMVLSRFLTPQAQLPQDPVLLMRETDYELPAIFPWKIEILP
ncbi:hypothetical protein GSS88_09860 [Corynebacterium sp. 3HC-13]|uniref:hypothetical protein n=1 Tax=Corynebacterium poyangense TaxID=2684405 RepID=UPI001CCB203C|nr:hypothetical protein [Corynebacterium poyangense]MBZ8178090.1 hypothetical protein [Corynebacterium poyangense]